MYSVYTLTNDGLLFLHKTKQNMLILLKALCFTFQSDARAYDCNGSEFKNSIWELLGRSWLNKNHLLY